MPSKPFSFGRVDFGLTAGGTPASATPLSNVPFRILILGDFSGRASRGLAETGAALANRRPVRVDRDNFDQVLAKFGGEVRVNIAGSEPTTVVIPVKELDDLHPDRLFGRVPLFQKLRELRSQLEKPATFAAAAEEVRSWSKAQIATAASESPPVAALPLPTSGEDLLAQMLGEAAPARSYESRPAFGSSEWDQFLNKIVAPHAVPGANPRQAELTGVVDEAIGVQMRSILHSPDFQAFEAAWRGLYFVVRRLETDASLQLYFLDLSKEELAADLAAAEDLSSTGLYKLLVQQTIGTPGAHPWAVLAGSYRFDHGRSDVELLGRLAKVAERAGAPFLAAAHSRIVGCESLAATPDPDDWKSLDADQKTTWQAPTQLPEATFLGLALPRFLLRLPYGKDSDPTERFEFEEMPEGADHEGYLWGSPGFVCACLLGEAFSRQGWDLRPGVIDKVDGLPMHVYRLDGETALKLPAEIVLLDRAVGRILGMGLMALRSAQGSDVVTIAGFSSLAADARPLAGRWTG